MMHFEQNNIALSSPLNFNIIIGLIVAQLVLFFYLLNVDITAIVLFVSLCSIPLVLTNPLLLKIKLKSRYLKISLIMFASGGFGMLLGCAIDLGQVGVYGLLSICQLTPYSLSGWGIDSVWQKIQLTPWTYIGMFTCGNLGMLFLDGRRSSHSSVSIKTLYLYIVCNIGMLMGMLLGEAIAIQLTGNINQLLAAGLMISLMLAGMTLGMITTLAITENSKQQPATVN